MGSPCLADVLGLGKKLVVGVGGLAVTNNQNYVLATYSLGSCLGITIYDPVSRAGGLLHAMLPDSSINPQKAAGQPAMFVDTGISALFRAAYELKAQKHRVEICVVGGSQILDKTGYFNIGSRNYDSLAAIFRNHGLAPKAVDVGGLASRNLYLNLNNGEVRVKVSDEQEDRVLFQG